jgi:hypothetical protein
MKLIYVAGIEHCGSTLTDHLLSRHPDAVGLGEVASFFSPPHMKLYLQQWGEFPDARMCSCGKSWTDCEVWGALVHLNGAVSEAPLIEKYTALLGHVRALFGDDAISIDSSKSLAGLTFIVDNRDLLGMTPDDFLAVLAIKDVRSFSASILRKQGADGSLRATYNVFKRWLYRNGQFFEYFRRNGCKHYVSLYEKLCADPERLNRDVYRLLGVERRPPVEAATARTHIAMGNKKFVANFQGHVSYDDGWQTNKRIKMAYLLHRACRRFNKGLYSVADDSAGR